MNEEWRAVPGFEGLYEASPRGYVRNIASGMGRTPGRVLKATPAGRYGHLRITLRRDKKSFPTALHRIICLTFNGPPPSPDKDNALHWDGDVTNNEFTNLRWGTRKENALDSMRHGTRRNQYTDVTECDNGHPYGPENSYINPKTGKRRCMTCQTTPPPPGDPRHGRYSTYGTRYCRCPECTEAWRIHSAEQLRRRKERKQ